MWISKQDWILLLTGALKYDTPANCHDVSPARKDLAMDQSQSKFLAFLAIIATALAGGAFALSWQSSNHFLDFSPANDGFVEPRDIAKLVEEAHKSTVQVNCVVSKKKGVIGTGWAIDSELLMFRRVRQR